MWARSPRSGTLRASGRAAGPARAKGPCARLCQEVISDWAVTVSRSGAALDCPRTRGKRADPQVSAESLLNHPPGSPQAQRGAALGAAGLGVGPPGESVEVRPVEAFPDEL